MRRISCLFALAVWLTGRMDGLAVERFVPQGGAQNYPTIQAAVTASLEGDIVRVQPGIYQESITFRNVNITLTSMNPSDSNVVQTTVIQGDGTRSVVRFAVGQKTNTIFTGFTVRGGGGTVFSGFYLLGGGIYCYQSSPTIVGNIIEENHLVMNLNGPIYSYGGAISCWQASPRIARNIIRNNSASYGGAFVSFSGKPLIQDNWIHNNTAWTGSAAYLSDQGIFVNNTLSENTPDNLYVDTTGLVANNIIANSTRATGVTANDNNLSWFQYNNVWEPAGTEILLNLQTDTNWVVVALSLAGTNGNLSVDPLFVSTTNFDFNLSAASPCINVGDRLGLRTTNELDIAGGSRIFALRVDMGASEFRGNRNFPPIADAGSDQTIYLGLSETAMLDGAASVDPDGSALNFTWRQIAGPPVTLLVTNTRAAFTPAVLGDYRFELVVNDGVYDSTPDAVRVVVTNFPPIASAGLGQSLPEIPEVLVLDGSHSLDPEDQPLVYNWRQIGGPTVTLATPQSPRPSVRPTGPGVYEFELTVSDTYNTSPPDAVKLYLGQVAPVANAGPTRYAGRTTITLDGSGSFAPNNPAPLQYAWSVVSGPALTLTPTNVAQPVVRGFSQMLTNREAVFELVVSAGGMTSAPSRVKMIIVPQWNNPSLTLLTQFKTNRPTIFGFGGGDCNNGSGMSEFTANWLNSANVFTAAYQSDSSSPPGDPRYFGYGDQLMVTLSSVAPGYDQPIQTIGFSTGCMPACDVAERFNVGYKDSRYQVNRITLIDSGCSRAYGDNISNLVSNRMPGKVFWIDNYYSVAGRFRPGTLNAEFPVPPADHSTPNAWYIPSWILGTPYSTNTFNRGVFGGAFFSVLGPGKNYQLETDQSEYYFGWNPPTSGFTYPPQTLVQKSPALYPARFPGVVGLTGPTNGTLAAARRIVFSSPPVVNAAKYQILIGPNAGRVDRVAWEGSSPPSQPLSKLPFVKTWWTIRVIDAYGTTSWADPRYVLRDSDRDNLTDELEILTYHTDPDNADTDGDGHLDGQELLAGTDPLQPNVGFSLRCRSVSPGQLRLTWFADAGNTYDLESSATWEFTSWQLIQTFVAPVGGGFIEHTIPLPADPSRLYRVRSYAVPAVSATSDGNL